MLPKAACAASSRASTLRQKIARFESRSLLAGDSDPGGFHRRQRRPTPIPGHQAEFLTALRLNLRRNPNATARPSFPSLPSVKWISDRTHPRIARIHTNSRNPDPHSCPFVSIRGPLRPLCPPCLNSDRLPRLRSLRCLPLNPFRPDAHRAYGRAENLPSNPTTPFAPLCGKTAQKPTKLTKAGSATRPSSRTALPPTA